jgi:CBS domain containing-hemolysin-like protein
MVGAAQVRTVPAAERATTTVGAVADHPVRVPASLPLPVVLERLRAAHRQLAIVIDEHGGFAGVVSLEDIAEELVGPILDEDDRDEPAPVLQADGSWLAPGRWRIDEIHETTGIALPEGEEYETVSGLVLRHLGHVAAPGDTVVVELASGHSNGNGHPATDPPDMRPQVSVEVITVRRHVPDTVRLTLRVAGSDAEADTEGTRR